MRDEFLEPLPTIKFDATLLFGKKAVPCHINAVTEDGFCVAVPGIQAHEGDPRLVLATDGGTIPVRLVFQEAYLDGFYFWLNRTNVAELSKRKECNFSQWKARFSQFCLPAMVAVVLAVCFGIPSSWDTTTQFHLVSFLTERMTFGGAPSANVSKDASSSVKQVLITDANPPPLSKFRSEEGRRPIASMSKVTQASLSAWQPSANDQELRNGTVKEASQSNIPPVSEADDLLLKLLADGKASTSRPLTNCNASWLNGVSKTHDNLPIRVSDTAIVDLQQFEAGLRDLPKSVASSAIVSLRRAIMAANSKTSNVKSVAQMTDLFVIASDDANIYYQVVQGRVELIRVLPIDFK